ncbi:MAG: hypothetical protein NTZ05_12605 [Chloroflexi bacterium]|nr:hypothetical protein [Chloroflexota bacterium]
MAAAPSRLDEMRRRIVSDDPEPQATPVAQEDPAPSELLARWQAEPKPTAPPPPTAPVDPGPMPDDVAVGADMAQAGPTPLERLQRAYGFGTRLDAPTWRDAVDVNTTFPQEVPGVPDLHALAVSWPDGSPPESHQAMMENLNEFLDRSPTDEELAAIRENLPAVVARGRHIQRRDPRIQMARHEWRTPDMMAEELARLADERRPFAGTAQFHRQNPNPPYGAVRGGPTMTQPIGGNTGRRMGETLADYMERAGVASPLADIYRTGGLSMGQIEGASGLSHGGRVDLHNFLQDMPEADVLQIARHEAAHEYDQARGFRDDPAFREGANEAFLHEPYMRRVTPSDPHFFAHSYTAPYDQGLRIEEIPPKLQGYYRDAQGAVHADEQSVAGNPTLGTGRLLAWSVG